MLSLPHHSLLHYTFIFFIIFITVWNHLVSLLIVFLYKNKFHWAGTLSCSLLYSQHQTLLVHSKCLINMLNVEWMKCLSSGWSPAAWSHRALNLNLDVPSHLLSILIKCQLYSKHSTRYMYHLSSWSCQSSWEGQPVDSFGCLYEVLWQSAIQQGFSALALLTFWAW